MATPLHARAAQVQAGLAPLSGQGVCTVWSQRFLWPLFRCHLEQLSDLLTVLLLLSLPGMALKQQQDPGVTAQGNTRHFLEIRVNC